MKSFSLPTPKQRSLLCLRSIKIKSTQKGAKDFFMLPAQVENIVDQDLVSIFELLAKWDWEADRSL